MSALFIGLMSGTSLNGVDGVLVDFSQDTPRVLSHQAQPFDDALIAELMALNTAGINELHRAALAANALVQVYAQVVQCLLTGTSLTASDIQGIGAHGQTVRHQPGLFDSVGYTLQLNNPSLLAELTGIAVVADFRSRDVAAGGQGAPLVPVFHQGMFGSAKNTIVVLNIGGIANVSLLYALDDVIGFDCGPGNALMDFWCHQHTGQPYDDNGQWGRSGRVIQPLLDAFMKEPFLKLPPPKSTGRDLFHSAWLAAHLIHLDDELPADVQATLTEFTALTCVNDVMRHAPNATELIVCGGGALNGFLMERLQANLPATCQVISSAARGMPALQVEACAFAWLARQTMQGLPGNAPKVTGAKGARILGGIYPA